MGIILPEPEPEPKKRRVIGNFASDAPDMPQFLYDYAEENERLRLYAENYRAIRHYVRPNRVQSIYNIRLTPTRSDFALRLEQIFHEQKNSFKINASFGYVLRHRVTHELRYFHASLNNHRMMDMPILVNTLQDYRRFVDALDSFDSLEYARQQRPDSQWVVDEVTNLSVYINHLDSYIQAVDAPVHIKNRQGVYCVDSTHNLCFFNCLALHKRPDLLADYSKGRNRRMDPRCRNAAVKRAALALYEGCSDKPVTEFPGVNMNELKRRDDPEEEDGELIREGPREGEGDNLSDLECLEAVFRVGIRIYRLERVRDKYFATLYRRPSPVYEDVMTLDLSTTADGREHFSYVHDLGQYAKFFLCL